MELCYNRLLLISLWQYNHHEEEGLPRSLFEETFGKTQGSHYYDKWMNSFNRNLWDMIAYFRGEGENGQKFCDMVANKSKYTVKIENTMEFTDLIQWTACNASTVSITADIGKPE